MAGGLKLKGGALDADLVVGGDADLELGEHLGGVTVCEACVVPDDVSGGPSIILILWPLLTPVGAFFNNLRRLP